MIYYKMTPIEKLFRSIVQKYDFDKYWRYRTVLVDPSKGNKITDAFRLYYIKRADAFNIPLSALTETTVRNLPLYRICHTV